ncbi:MAG: type IV pilus secretin PilQ [Nitrospinae bacterium]|nr:type IV pilus secretin PilQ [Nitrospinota bacterium]
MQNAKCKMQNAKCKRQEARGRKKLYIAYCLLLTAYCILSSSGCATPKKIASPPPAKAVESKPAQTKAEEPARKPSLTKIYAEPLPDKVNLNIEATDPLQYTAFKLNDPLRFVIDLSNMDTGDVKGPIQVEKGAVGTITLHYFQQSNTSRVEIGLNTPVSHEISKPAANRLIVALKNPEEKKHSSGTEPITAVSDVAVQKLDDNKTRISVKTEGGEPRFTLIKREDLKRLSIEIENARISPEGQKALDTSQISAFVKKVSSFQYKNDPMPIVRVVAELTELSSYNISREGTNIILDIEPPGAALKGETKIPVVSGANLKEAAVDAVVSEKKYEGKKISLDLQKADIIDILRLIADVSNLNVITSDDVQGKITMRLINIPWDQALDVILKTNKLDMIREGNIIRIAPAVKIAEERKAFMEAKKAVVESKVVEEEAEELATEIFSISYSTAGDLTKNLEKIKSKRGDITIDVRTNTIIVKDTKRKIADMKSLIEKLDKRTPQVLIEARIVEVNRNYSKELGIEWGGKFNMTTDANFPNTVGITGTSLGTTSTTGTAVSLPAAVGSGTGGAISATLGSVTGATQLDLRLSALESTGKARILSTPKITAMDNKEAVIESGRSIPYPTTSSAGTSIQFADATISLVVTPRITPDNYVSMKIVATKNEADFANQVQGTPSIIKKKANTELLVKDGDTTVIGGLYKTTKTESVAGVPWFMKIPILGWLFKKQIDKDDGEELLIFITPKIVRI